jgi:ABC-type Mn2+/Zn2+ transport system ATPase subunit
VPRLVRIVHQAARELQFQVIMISHHDIGLFEKYADKVYRLSPERDELQIAEVGQSPSDNDLD